jgi:hypothetical protein
MGSHKEKTDFSFAHKIILSLASLGLTSELILSDPYFAWTDLD